MQRLSRVVCTHVCPLWRRRGCMVEHLKLMAGYGYGYSRQEVVDLGTDFAIQIGKRDLQHPLTLKWFRGFVRRWPEIHVLKPRSLEMARAKSASLPVVSNYFTELKEVIEKYGFDKQPHLIYNVDEKGVTLNHTPPSVVCGTDVHPQAVTAGKSNTTTIIGGGSASGVAIPPFFIFAGKKLLPDLMTGATPGAVGRVSDSGWSNSVLSQDYLENHFLKYVPLKDDQKVLLLLDGHRSHASVGLVEWAKQKNIILYILPAHTSHILQHMDVGCYGPLQKMYNSECHKFTRAAHCTITRYNVCQLVCKVYNKALSAENLISSFRRTGIHPCTGNADIIPSESFKPAEVFRVTSTTATSEDPADADVQELEVNRTNQTPADADVQEVEVTNQTPADATIDLDGEVQEAEVTNQTPADATIDLDGEVQEVEVTNQTPAGVTIDHDGADLQVMELAEETSTQFFSVREESLRKVKSEGVRKERRTLSKIISGHCITEEPVLKRMNEHVNSSTSSVTVKKQKKSVQKKSVDVIASTSSVTVKKQKKSVQKKSVVESESESDCEESGMEEKDLCCVCKLHTPKEIRYTDSLIFAKWAQCDGERDGQPCMHWTHLKYCTNTRVLRRKVLFFCPHCTPASTEE